MSNRTSEESNNLAERILSIVKESNFPLDDKRTDSYLETYSYFVKYFKKLDKITYHDAVIGAHAVYGWMPTVLTLHDGDSEKKKTEIVELLNDVRASKALDGTHLEVLKAWMNNSIVGVSKLLHFINPEMYPIWDSNINGVLFDDWRYDQTNDVQPYLKYQEVMVECAQDSEFNSLMIKDEMTEKSDTLSNLRQIEMKLFYFGKTKRQI